VQRARRSPRRPCKGVRLIQTKTDATHVTTFVHSRTVHRADLLYTTTFVHRQILERVFNNSGRAERERRNTCDNYSVTVFVRQLENSIRRHDGDGTVVFIRRGQKKNRIGRGGAEGERVVQVIHLHGKSTGREGSGEVTRCVHERANTRQVRVARSAISLWDEATVDQFNKEENWEQNRQTYVSSNVLTPSQTSCVIVIGTAKKKSERK
jgi:hypothetical protein